MPEKSLEDRLHEKIRLQGKSRDTAKTYWHWCRRYLQFAKQAKPKEGWASAEVAAEKWLTYLINVLYVSATTQNVALQAICYLYREVLDRPLVGVNAIRSKRPNRVREVLDVSEIARLFEQLTGPNLLAAQLMYGAGLRIGDVVALRVKDLHFERRQLHIHDGKGQKDRHAQFPEVLHAATRRQLDSCRTLWQWDQANNPGGVSLPGAFVRKSPKAAREWSWFYLFPSDNLSRNPATGKLARHHRDKSHLSREIKRAVERAGIEKRITSHNLRHCYATHSHEQGVSLKSLQALLGHTDIRTTETYLHADKNLATATRSPLENLLRNPPRPVRRAVVQLRRA